MTAASPTPFRLAVPQDELDDLQARLQRLRWPGEPRDAGWSYGANLDYMRALMAHWRDRYDWRAAEASINRFPQFTAPVPGPDGAPLDLHFIHEKGSGDDPLPLLLLHGWPGSIAEFLEAIEPLAHPERFGGDPADAFSVIAPSLPGYGFSAPPPAAIGPRAMAGMFSHLMRDVLGYERYVAQGGDWGSIIVARLALDHPDGLAALHLNMTPVRPDLGPEAPPLDEEEKAWIAQAREMRKSETAYQEVQATKSQSLAYGMHDSPLALAAWITEKFHGWSAPEAEVPPFDMDRLLTNIMIYWVGGCFNSSAWLYRGVREDGSAGLAPGERIRQPLGFCLPKNDLVPPPPPQWLRRLGNVVSETRLPDGGHFTMMQKGPEMIADIRQFFRAHAR